MKKALSLILAVVMLLGCMSVTAFAEESDLTITKADGTPATPGVDYSTHNDYVWFRDNQDGLDNTKTYDRLVIFSNDLVISGKKTKPVLIQVNSSDTKVTLDGVDLMATPCTNVISGSSFELVLKGNSTINSEGHAEVINAGGALTISGKGSLTVNNNYSSNAIYTSGGITMKTPGCSLLLNSTGGVSCGAIIAGDGVELSMTGSTTVNDAEENFVSNITFKGNVFPVIGEENVKSMKIVSSSKTHGESPIEGEIKVEDFTYSIIIPSKTTLTEDNHTAVQLGGENGKASIAVTGHPSDLVNVYYTVDLTKGDLTNGKGTTIDATYTYAQGGADIALNDATQVTVYAGGTVRDSVVKVTANDAQWAAAPIGNYNAAVMFNFDTKLVTIADILPNDFPTTTKSWFNTPTTRTTVYKNGENLTFFDQANYGTNFNVPLTTPVAAVTGGYNCTVEDASFTFNMTGNALTSIVAANTGKDDLNGTYTEGMTVAALLTTFNAGGPDKWIKEGIYYIEAGSNYFSLSSRTVNYSLYKSDVNQYQKQLSDPVDPTMIFTFNIEDGVLKNIVVSSNKFPEYNGTYTASTVD